MTDASTISDSPTAPLITDEVVRQYTPYLRNIIKKVVRGNAEIDDLIQETFINAMRGAHRFKKEHNNSLKCWLGKIAFNESLSYLRKVSRFVELDETFVATLADEARSVFDPRQNPLDFALRAEALEGLGRVYDIAQDPDNSKLRLFLEYAFNDRTNYDELAVRDNVAVGTTKSRMNRGQTEAYERLRGVINNNTDEDSGHLLIPC